MIVQRLKNAGGRAFKRLVAAREQQARRLVELHCPRNDDLL